MTLMSFEKRWATTALTGIYAQREDGVRVSFEHVDASLDETMRVVPWRSGMGLRIAIWMVALSPIWLLMRLGTIASVSAADRGAALARLIYHRNYFVRQLALLFKAFGALWVFRDPVLREAVVRPRERLMTLKKKETGHVAA